MKKLLLLCLLLPAFNSQALYFFYAKLDNSGGTNNFVTGTVYKWTNGGGRSSVESLGVGPFAVTTGSTPYGSSSATDGTTYQIEYNTGGVSYWSPVYTFHTGDSGNYPCTVVLYNTNSPSYQTTNFVLTAVNGYSVPAKAVWKYNGTQVKAMVLQPGQSAIWTTPSIRLNPPPADTWTANVSITPVYSTLGVNDNGDLLFQSMTNQTLSTSAQGSAVTNTLSGGTATNAGGNVTFGTSGSVAATPSTNNILWQTPSGAASESTLQGGFNILHKDLNDLQAGQTILNQSINTQTFMVTNQLGQISTYTRSNNDAAWQLLGFMRTNTASSGASNTVSLSLTNYATESTSSNILATARDLYGAFNTNFLPFFLDGFTNSSATNIDLSDTNLSRLPDTNFSGYVTTSNELDGATVEYGGLTNLTDVTAASKRLADATGLTTQENNFDSLLAGITDFSSGIYEYWPPVDMTIDIASLSHVGSSGILDLDPMHVPWAAELFSVTRRCMMWLLAFWFLVKVTEDAWKVIFVITGTSNINASTVKATVKKHSEQGL